MRWAESRPVRARISDRRATRAPRGRAPVCVGTDGTRPRQGQPLFLLATKCPGAVWTRCRAAEPSSCAPLVTKFGDHALQLGDLFLRQIRGLGEVGHER